VQQIDFLLSLHQHLDVGGETLETNIIQQCPSSLKNPDNHVPLHMQMQALVHPSLPVESQPTSANFLIVLTNSSSSISFKTVGLPEALAYPETFP